MTKKAREKALQRTGGWCEPAAREPVLVASEPERRNPKGE